MSNERFRSLCEAAWRRPLTEVEHAELAAVLAAQPEAQADWQAEAGLNEALRRLPDAPLPSNFTARVMQQIERESAAGERERLHGWRLFDLRRWLPRFAVGAVATGVVVASIQIHVAADRAKLGRSLAMLVEVTPAPDSLTDFDSIRKLNPELGADTELLALLQ